jgi:hypothetical protein
MSNFFIIYRLDTAQLEPAVSRSTVLLMLLNKNKIEYKTNSKKE